MDKHNLKHHTLIQEDLFCLWMYSRQPRRQPMMTYASLTSRVFEVWSSCGMILPTIQIPLSYHRGKRVLHVESKSVFEISTDYV